MMSPMSSASSRLMNRRTASSAESASKTWNDTEVGSLAMGGPEDWVRWRCSIVKRIPQGAGCNSGAIGHVLYSSKGPGHERRTCTQRDSEHRAHRSPRGREAGGSSVGTGDRSDSDRSDI